MRAHPQAFPGSLEDDWSDVSLIDREGTNTYPMVLISYCYVRQNISWQGNDGKQTLQWRALLVDHSAVPF